MNHTSYFMSGVTDEAVWEHLQVLLHEYDPEMEAKYADYISALETLKTAGADTDTFHQAIRTATISDALFAFQKGMEANLYHFQHPYVPSFVGVDFEDAFQEHIMMCMPKRLKAEQVITATQKSFFQDAAPWCETISEYIIDLEILVPKIMHFEGYKAGNVWFTLTIPSYSEDAALTSKYCIQLCKYFGNHQ